MASPRRIRAPDAKNRTVLVEAAEPVMLQEGYAAVTSRRVAREAGLKPQLVHYSAPWMTSSWPCSGTAPRSGWNGRRRP